MPNFRRYLTRRWLLACVSAPALGFGLLMLHPYPRQSLFGPTIDGVPWCVWEGEIRSAALRSKPKSWFFILLEKVGLLKPSNRIGITEHPQLLPVYLHLADDLDMNVRRFSMASLDRRDLRPEFWRWSQEDEATILPVMRQHLQDDDPMCRLICAQYIWSATKDRKMIKVPLAYLDHPDPWIQRGARITLCYLALANPDSFDPISKLAEDATLKKDVRVTAIESMRHFGERGLPVI